jgi:hypothetical protein
MKKLNINNNYADVHNSTVSSKISKVEQNIKIQ